MAAVNPAQPLPTIITFSISKFSIARKCATAAGRAARGVSREMTGSGGFQAAGQTAGELVNGWSIQSPVARVGDDPPNQARRLASRRSQLGIPLRHGG